MFGREEQIMGKISKIVSELKRKNDIEMERLQLDREVSIINNKMCKDTSKMYLDIRDTMNKYSKRIEEVTIRLNATNNKLSYLHQRIATIEKLLNIEGNQDISKEE
jgi:hypothetical protein